jgi:endonuclease III
MIDPTKFTNFGLNTNGLQEYILFAVGVAGKDAMITSKLLDKLLKKNKCKTPFNSIRAFKSESNLKSVMKETGFGCYTLKAKGFWYLANSKINLATCSVEELEACPGIGMKTARFFIMHTRSGDCNVACLDTHVLKFMRDQGFDNIPKQTPTRKRYLEIQDNFLNICKKKNLHPAVFDLQIWNEYRERK